MSNFKIGDVVILKSGDPAMTVHKIGDYISTSPDVGLKCIWFDGVKQIEAVFHPDAVELYAVDG